MGRRSRRAAVAAANDWAGRAGPALLDPPRILAPEAGAWYGAAPNMPGGPPAGDAATLAEFEAVTGRSLQVVRAYAANGMWGPWFQPGSQEADAVAAGKTLAFSAKYGHYDGNNVKTDGWSWAEVAAQAPAAVAALQARADELAALDRPVFVCFHHESDTGDVNGTDHPTYGLAADYAEAWRVAHGIFSATCPKAIFVLNYGGYKTHAAWWQNAYPGDAYVDWIAADHYALSTDGVAPTPMEQVSTTFRVWMNNTKPGRHDMPWAIWETACHDDPGLTGVAKRAWFETNNDWFEQVRQLKMVLYWSDYAPNTASGLDDFWPNSSPVALDGYREYANAPWMVGVLPPPVPGYVGQAAGSSNDVNVSVVLPTDIEQDDVALLVLATAGAAIVDPAGWVLIGEQTDGSGFTTRAYFKVCAPADSSALVEVPTAAIAVHNSLSATVWRGLNVESPVYLYASAAEGSAGGTPSHATPSLPIDVETRIIEVVADKGTPGGSAWTAPAGAVIRSQTYAAGDSGATSIAVADRDRQPAGVAGPSAYTSDLSSTTAAMWTFALLPDDVTPAGPATTPTFRVAASAWSNAASVAVSIPPVHVGDIMLLALSTSGQVAVGDPAGWTLIDQLTDGASFTQRLWWREAASGDAGTVVTVPCSSPGPTQNVLAISAYQAVDTAAPILGYAKAAEGTVATGQHAAPALVTGGRALIVEVVGDKLSPGSTAWTPPAGMTVRAEQHRNVSGGVSLALADNGGEVVPGTYGGDGWGSDASTPVAGMWTVALKAQPDPEQYGVGPYGTGPYGR